jgi:acetyl-CoA acetyltransferase
MSLDDYLDARMIATPLCLYDCDTFDDGGIAFVLSHREAAADIRSLPIAINAVGTALHGRPSYDQREDITTTAASDAARHLWSRTELTPADVDTAHVYDGFTFATLFWLEALGFCAKGEGGPFVEGGTRIALDGELPTNTDGGQLSFARLEGLGHLREAVLQLRGQAGERQVKTHPEVAVVANGVGPICGCLLVTRGI